MLKSERHKFRMHGTVLHIDAVGDTNEEDRPLVTFTIRDSEGRQITCLRVFMPGERAWAFRWLFLIVLPTLLGVAFLQLIQVSKYLFESFLRSDEVVEVAGVENILSFVRDHMQPHESHYCFHLRKFVRHFDTHINSSHEGTNKRIKYGAAPCLPNYSTG